MSPADEPSHDPERPRHTPVKPVPGVTWRSHLGCGALFGFCLGFFGALKRGAESCALPLLVGLAGAVLIGFAAAVLGDRFWLNR